MKAMHGKLQHCMVPIDRYTGVAKVCKGQQKIRSFIEAIAQSACNGLSVPKCGTHAEASHA